MMETQICLLRVTFLVLCVIHLDIAYPKTEIASKFASLPNDICPVLKCGSKNITVTFTKESLTKLKVDLNKIHLIDPTCKGFSDNDKTISIQSPTKVGQCGTYVIVNKTHAIYKNNIYLKPDPSLIIYREDYMVNVSCVYPLNMDVSLGTVLHPITRTIYIDVKGHGQFEVKMAVFKDPAYLIPRETGDVLSTKDMLYVGVTLTEGDTSRFHLVMEECFATPTDNINDLLKYYIIKDSCPNVNDKTIHIAANGIASYGQFSVQAFKFIGGYSEIYLHCQIHLCDYKTDSCLPICDSRSNRVESSQSSENYVSLGAIAVKDPEQLCPDLKCGASYINVTFQKDDLKVANVDIPYLHINEKTCHDVREDQKTLSVGWPLGVGKCGTTLTTNASHAIYGNSIYLAPNPSQIIYRKEYYINVSCIYPLDMNVSLQKVLNPMIRTIYLDLEGAGKFEVIMAAFKDQAYQEPYESREIKLSTQKRLFVGVFISEGDTNEFDLVMQDCYATPTNNPHDAINYGIIVDSCPNAEDGTIQVYANGISSQAQFSIQMFKFINHNYVYLHCKVRLCRKSSGTCIPDCFRSKFRSSAEEAYTVSLGPFHHEASNSASLTNDICPELKCGAKNITVTFPKESLTKLKVDLNNIQLIDPTCKGFSYNDTSISIQSPTKVGQCGTYVIVNKTHAIYRNNIYLKPNPSLVIYREDYMVNVSCVYPLTMDVSPGTVLNPIMRTIYIYAEGYGRFEVIMAVFKDPAYTIPRETADVLSTKDMLYVGVTLTEGDTSHFHLVMKECFATPTDNINDLLKYYIIKDSCPNENDKTIHIAANGIASYGLFSVQAFKFIGGYSEIHLHCQIHLCDYKTDSCVPICNPRRIAGKSYESPLSAYVSLGAITIKDPEQLCPDLKCGASYINVTFQKDDLIDANVDIPNLHINEKKCHDVHEDGKTLSVGWPLGVGKCGTTLTTNASHAIYWNSIYLAPNPSQIIYRKEYYINVSCIYPLDMNVSLHKVLKPMIRTIYLDLVGVGKFEVIMAVFKDQDYQVPYESGEIKLSTQERLFVGVFISEGDTNEFDLVMQECYATPTNNPQDAVNYGIIVNSCPNAEDGTVQVYANGISSQAQFSIQMFKFINYNYVFLHCQVHLCRKSSGTCIPDCYQSKFRSSAEEAYTVSLGPFYREDSGDTPESPANTTTSATTTTTTTTTSATTTTKITQDNDDSGDTPESPANTTTSATTTTTTTSATTTTKITQDNDDSGDTSESPPHTTTSATTTATATTTTTTTTTTTSAPTTTTTTTTTSAPTTTTTTTTSATTTTTKIAQDNTDPTTEAPTTTMTTKNNAGKTCFDLLTLIAVLLITLML